MANGEEFEKACEDDAQLKVLKMCYRKHVTMDDSIGWDQLSNEIANVLCERMGDDTFQKWIEEMSGD